MGPQLNGNTHWLDGSVVYSSTELDLANLRLGQDGILKNSTSEDGKELLPLKSSCPDATCYYAGSIYPPKHFKSIDLTEEFRISQVTYELKRIRNWLFCKR